jgi:hypothetical protein
MKDYAIQIVSRYVPLNVSKQIVYALMEEGIIKTTNFGDKDIDDTVKLFKELFGTSKASSKDRYATKRMIDTHGVQNLQRVIVELARRSGGQYSPTVNSLSQLEEKWVSVTKYIVANNTQYID